MPAFAWLYAYAVWYCPLIYINFFITLAFGGLIGFVIHVLVIGSGKVRSPGTASLFGLVGGFLGLYVHWAIWIDLAINAEDGKGILVSHVNYDQLFEILRDPIGLFRVAMAINETGLWSIFTIQFSGFALGLIWFVEAIMILVFPVLIALQKVQKPFSEKDNRWAKEITLSAFEYIQKPAGFKKMLEENDATKLRLLKKASSESHHSEFTLYDAKNDEWYLSVTNKYAKQDEKGKIKFEDDTFIKYLSIRKDWAEVLQTAPEAEPETSQNEGQESTLNPAQDQAMYDTHKTKIIATLLELPPDQRTDDWQQRFNENILRASFTCGNPQVVQGPDGLPYFMLQYPESKKPFNPFSLVSIKEHVLKNGYGVALTPDGNQVVWSIPHGAMVNLHINGELFTEADDPTLPEREVLHEPTEVLTGQPAEDFLPTATREVLKDFLQTQGIAEPKIMLMARHRDEGTSTELVFNIFAEDYPAEEHFEALMHQVQWFLPRHYIITALPKQPEFMENLKPL